MRKTLYGVLFGVLITLVVVVPVLAAYYAYIYVEETDGNSYDELPLACATNVTLLAENHFISSTGLDTRVLTGSGEALPHMLANDKVMFVTDLEAYEDKTLLFYLGASSLSSFPIIVGYNGSITTGDDPDLELSYVLELIASGYFDASAGSDKNILYKEDAFRMNISAANTLRVAALNATGDEQWEVHYSSFTSGEHTVYVMANGLAAHLYVDDFDVAKDTENLFESSKALISNTNPAGIGPTSRVSFYTHDRYWAFYRKGTNDDICYKTSADGLSWSGEYTISVVAGDDNQGFGVWFQGSHMQIVYGGKRAGDDYVRYRRGEPEADNSITWSAGWQNAATVTYDVTSVVTIAVDSDGYPFVIYGSYYNNVSWTHVTTSSTKDGTWTTAGGYPVELRATSQSPNEESITAYPSSDKIYALWSTASNLYGRYYNGSSWVGSPETIDDSNGTVYRFTAVADADDNLCIVWEDYTYGKVYLRVRYADGSFSSIVEVASGSSSPSVSYNDVTGYVYIIYYRSGGIRCRALVNDTLSGEYLVTTTIGSSTLSAAPYENYIGIVYLDDSYTYHGYLAFPWEWNDNANNWTWMQNNVMPYSDIFQMGIDGVLELEYEPATIIQGTTLPDVSEASGHDGIITWGTNPDGVDVSISQLQLEEDESGAYYYQPIQPGSQDIIKPEPAEMTTDVDLERLENNPLNPMVEAMAAMTNGQLTERLIWIGGGFFWLIVAMVGTFILSKHNMLFTSSVGLGISILWYVWAIFPLWVVILLAFGVVASIVYERMPTL